MAAMTMISIRVPEKLLARFDAAAEAAGCRNRSAWARKVLVQAAGGKTEPVAPSRSLPLQPREGGSRQLTGACKHPTPARVQRPFEVICGLCGVRVK